MLGHRSPFDVGPSGVVDREAVAPHAEELLPLVVAQPFEVELDVATEHDIAEVSVDHEAGLFPHLAPRRGFGGLAVVDAPAGREPPPARFRPVRIAAP